MSTALHYSSASLLAKRIYNGEASSAMQMGRVSSPLSLQPQLGHCSDRDTPAAVKYPVIFEVTCLCVTQACFLSGTADGFIIGCHAYICPQESYCKGEIDLSLPGKTCAIIWKADTS